MTFCAPTGKNRPPRRAAGIPKLFAPARGRRLSGDRIDRPRAHASPRAVLVGVYALSIDAAKIATLVLVFLFNLLSRRALLFSPVAG